MNIKLSLSFCLFIATHVASANNLIGADILKLCKSTYEQKEDVVNKTACRFYYYGVLDEKTRRLNIAYSTAKQTIEYMQTIDSDISKEAISYAKEAVVISYLEKASNQSLLGFCQKGKKTNEQMLRIIYKYALEHPELEHISASDVLTEALMKTFPMSSCREKLTKKQQDKKFKELIDEAQELIRVLDEKSK